MQRLQLGLFAVGVFVALVYIGAVFSTQVAAIAVGRLGPIRTSQLSLLCTAIGVLLLTSTLLPLAALGAVVIGLGYGPITPASSQMLARSTDPRHYALVFSIKQTGVPLGGVLAGLIVPPLAAFNSGVVALLGLAVMCVVAALSAMPLARELDRERVASARWPHWRDFLGPVRVVMAHRVLRSVALCSLVFSIVQVTLTSYMVSYLTADLGWTLARAGGALAMAQFFGVGARIGWGYWPTGGSGRSACCCASRRPWPAAAC
ncbi:MFS transporter [Aquabacterium sp. J223]|nr:MFS transporter [Aquabacterium sp. J223]